MTMKRFIVRVSRNMRDSMSYALSEPWYMFVMGLLLGMALIAAHDSHTIRHLQLLTTTLSNHAAPVEEHPRVAAPVAVEQSANTEVCVEQLLDGIVEPVVEFPAETEPVISAPPSDEVEAPHAAYWRKFILTRAANGW
jgi:hypothetical protein